MTTIPNNGMSSAKSYYRERASTTLSELLPNLLIGIISGIAAGGVTATVKDKRQKKLQKSLWQMRHYLNSTGRTRLHYNFVLPISREKPL